MVKPRPPSRFMRWVYIAFGVVALALGVIGIFLPLLPTTPFLLAAAWAFALGSPSLHKWLVGHRRFGPFLAAWREHRAIPARAKVVGIVFMWTGATVALVWQLDRDWARALVVGTAVVVTAVLLAFPTATSGGHVKKSERAASPG